jgi:hypothetical protein
LAEPCRECWLSGSSQWCNNSPVSSSLTVSLYKSPNPALFMTRSFNANHAAKSDAEPSISSTTCRTRSNATSTPTTAIVGRLCGPLPPKPSSKNSLTSRTFCLSQCIRLDGTRVPVPRFGVLAVDRNTTGAMYAMPLWAQTSVDAVKRMQPGAEIVREIPDEVGWREQ